MKQKESKAEWPLLYQLIEGDIDLDTLSRNEIISMGRVKTSKVIRGTLSHWTAFINTSKAAVMGSRKFWRPEPSVTATFKDGKFYGEWKQFIPLIVHYNVFPELEWIDGACKNCLGTNKTMWKNVFNGKFTNPEQMFKWFFKRYFKSAFSYKYLKEYYTRMSDASLYDLWYYTTNPEIALQKLIALRADIMDNRRLFLDSLHYAKILNTKINPAWSQARLELEHQRQIRLVKLEEINSLNADNIIPQFSKEGLSLITNERECYLEGLNMENCVHSCYWRHVKKGTYLLAHGIINSEYIDLGITVYPDSVSIEQVHTKYNGTAAISTRLFCVNWVIKYAKELLEIAKSVADQKENQLVTYVEDIPF